jgi:hypothetical protein
MGLILKTAKTKLPKSTKIVPVRVGTLLTGQAMCRNVTLWCLRLMFVQGDQKVSVHLMITIQKDTNNVQSVPRQFSCIYFHAELCSERPCSI